jgi:hypothetical protein
VRRLAERAPELPAEVGAREPSRTGEIVDVQLLEEAGIGEVLGAEEVTGRRYERHRSPE